MSRRNVSKVSESGLSRLLLGWGLAAEVVSGFEAEGFTLRSIKYAGEQVINKIIAKEGPRCLFKAKLAEYVSEESSDSFGNSNTSVENWESFEGPSTSTPIPPRKRTASQVNHDLDSEVPVTKKSGNPEASSINESDNAGKDKSGRLSITPEEPSINESNNAGKDKSGQLSITPEEPSINSLHTLLKLNPEGIPILAYYNRFGCLDESRRDDLSARIIYSEIQNNFDKRIDKSRYAAIAKEIEELFPTESAITWYSLQEKNRKISVTGRLFHKFYNTRRYLIKVGLISSSRLQQEVLSDEELDLDLGDIEDDDNILWLKTHDADFTDVILKWDSCADLRRLLQRKYTIFEYIKKFAYLKLKRGWELLSHECELLHPDWRGQIENDWPIFLDFIEQQFQQPLPTKKKGSNSAGANSSQALDSEDTVNSAHVSTEQKKEKEVLRTINLLGHLADLFRPRPVPKPAGTPKSVSTWKPSRSEVQESFFLHCESGQLAEIVQSRRTVLAKFHHTLQPFVAVIGPRKQVPRQYLIIVDKQFYEAKSALEALDACFKIYFAVNGAYPAESRHIWLLIQRTVYQYKCPDDYKGDKGLESFLASFLKKFQLFVESRVA